MANMIRVTCEGPVVDVALDRPERRNALDRAMLEELRDRLQEVAAKADVHVVILHGIGPGFCSGADLQAMAQLHGGDDPSAAFMPSVDLFQETVALVATMPKVTIAALHGFALGAGFDLSLACDLRLAASGTQFASSYVRFGLVPDGGATWALPRLIGKGPALALLLTGDPVDTEGAYRLGLIHRRTPAGRHLEVAQQWARELAAGSHPAQVAIKRLARVDPRLTLFAALKEEREAQRRVVADREPFKYLQAYDKDGA
ncbi:MAG: enoyl-CoA hydratase/isomerase family protein [Acidobacteriota bacterium]